MLTTNCNAHPLLSLMHRPDLDATGRPLPHDQQDKRTVVPLDRPDWEQWLHVSPADAAQLLRVPAPDLYTHGAVDPAQHVELATPPGLFSDDIAPDAHHSGANVGGRGRKTLHAPRLDLRDQVRRLPLPGARRAAEIRWSCARSGGGLYDLVPEVAQLL